MPLGSSIISTARAILTVERQGFDHSLAEAQGRFHRFATEQKSDLQSMSSHQLKAVRYQREYTASVARFGPESSKTIRALERLKLAEEQVARQSRITAQQEQRVVRGGRRGLFGGGRLRGAEHEAGAAGRGALAASGAFRHLGRSVAYASSFFLGGYGLLYAFESSIAAATKEEQAMASLRATLAHVGLSWQGNKQQIEANLGALARHTAFSQTTLIGTFNTLVRRTGDVSEAFKLNALAADIARGKGISLQQATSLLIRAMSGNARAATTLGLPLINTSKLQDRAAASGRKLSAADLKSATAKLVLASATRRYGGQAAAFLQTTAGKQEQLRRALEDSQAIIGRALLPTVSRLASRFANYLDKLNRTGQLQRRVNSAIRTTGAIARTVERGVHILANGFHRLNRFTGGTSHTIRLLGGAFVALKIFRWVTGAGLLARAIRRIGLAALRTIPALEGLAIAEAEVGAAGGVGAAGAAGKLGLAARIAKYGAAGLLLGAEAPAIGDVIKIAAGSDPFSPFNTSSGKPENSLNGNARRLIKQAQGGSPSERKRLYDPDAHGRAVARRFGFDTPYDVVEAYWNHHISIKRLNAFANAYYGTGSASHDENDRRRGFVENQRAQQAASGRGRPGGGRRPPPITQIPIGLQEQLAQAELTKTETDDLRVLRKEQRLLRKALRDKRLTATQRIDLLGQLKDVNDQITSLTEKHKHKRHKKAEIRGDKLIPQSLRLALAKARTTEGEADDLKALNAEDRYLRKVLKDKHLSKNRREALLNELSKVDREIKSLKKKKDDGEKGLSAGAQERQAFLAQQMGFFSEFAPDIFTSSKAGLKLGSTGGKTVIVNQHFNAPPQSNFQTFHQANFAAQHVL